MKNELKAAATQNAINNASGGTSQWHQCGGLVITDGVKSVCETAGAFWLLDIIRSYQFDKRLQKDEMLQHIQFWLLDVDLEKNTAVVTLERDSDDVVLTQKIPFTDFPLAKFKLYYTPAEKIVLLPNEY
jgi:hypothetical protein